MNAPALALLTAGQWAAMPLTARLLTAASFYMGTGAAYGGSACPFTVPKSFARLDTGKSVVCSPFTAVLLAAAYPAVPWSSAHWAALNVYDGGHLDSPVQIAQVLGIGDPVSSLVPGQVHLVQAWASVNPPKGHAFFAWLLPDGREVLLQSSSRGDVGPTLDTFRAGTIARRWSTVYFAALRGP